MYDVMLVDDEKLITQGLMNIIDWENLGLKVREIAHNGEEALNKFKENPYVEAVFHTIRPTSTGLIVGACWGVVEITMFYVDKFNISSKLIDLFNFKSIIFALILFFLIKYTNKHPVIYIALSAVVGILLSF